MTSAGKRFLIVGPSWVGDMIMSQSLYRLLRQRYPEAGIDVLAPGASMPLVARMAEVDRGILMKSGHGELQISYRLGLARHLSETGYTDAIVLPNSLKSALIPFFANIPVRTGFRGEYRYLLINDMRMLNAARLPRMVDRFVALGVRAGAEMPEPEPPRLTVDTANQREACDRLALSTDRPVLGLCPGAEFGDAKRWPTGHFAAVADRAIEAGMQVWIFGGPGDISVADSVLNQLRAEHRSHCRSLAGQTSLIEAVDLLALCRQVISNDSGLMHMAAALDVPVAVLYGSTSSAFTPPLSSKATTLSMELACSPCFKRICPLGHKNCLVQLLPDKLSSIVDRAAVS